MTIFCAAVLLISASAARAQTNVGAAAEAGTVPGGQAGSLTSTLPGGAPLPVTLNLISPAPSLTPGLAHTAPKPVALALAAAASPVGAIPALAESAIVPVQPSIKKLVVMKPADNARPTPKASLGEVPQDLDKISVADLIDATKALFGESSPGRRSADYLRLGEPLEFGEQETFRYRSALNVFSARRGAEETEGLLSAGEAMAKSAGIATVRGERTMLDGAVSPVVKIAPRRDGHRLNRLAWDLERVFGAAVEYAPQRTRGGVAAYNSADNVLFLPDFGNEKAFEAILHESRHASFAKRLRTGDLSVFHACLLAYQGRSIAPNAETYERYMSLEEISTHAKTLLHALMRAQSGDASAATHATTYGFQLMDVLRSAEINLFQLQRRIAKGEVKSYRVVSPTFPDFPGGHWEAINLPHAILALPVRDEAPAPKRNLWNRLFSAEPETPAAKAARRHVEAVRPLIAAMSTELESFLKALRDDAPDLNKARAVATRMTRLAKKADEAFAAMP
ncbi:MAG: hypothetical protein HY923_09810 [Elusimicrobia bacterium]|nr:hypothetical protein [Elusimicrobiota bacterium]